MKSHNRYSVFADFKRGELMERRPLPRETKIALAEKFQEHKEYLRRGEAYKKNSTKMFGGTE
jgi:hypothetical protein